MKEAAVLMKLPAHDPVGQRFGVAGSSRWFALAWTSMPLVVAIPVLLVGRKLVLVVAKNKRRS